jgi:hypothetical protein
MADASIIKEFLVSAGFAVDEASLKKFNAALGSSALAASALGAAVVASAAAIFSAVKNIAGEYDELDKLALKLNTTVDALDEFADIGQVIGLSKAQTVGSLESLNRAMSDTALGVGRAKKIFESLGVAVVDAAGKMRPTTEVMDDLSEKFKGMDRGKAMAVMNRLGLDPSLIRLFNADLSTLRAELAEIDKAAGFDLGHAVEESKAFTTSWRLLKQEFEKFRILFSKTLEAIAIKLMPILRRGMDDFAKKIKELRRIVMEDMGAVRDFLFDFARGVVLTFAAAWQLLGRVIDVVAAFVRLVVGAFNMLDPVVQKLIIGVGLFAAAWRYLSLAMLANPIVLIAAALTGLLLLIDDFIGYKEGLQSFFDWSAVVPAVDMVTDAVMWLMGVLGDMFAMAINGIGFLYNLLTGNFTKAWDDLVYSLMSVWSIFTKILDVVGLVVDGVAKLFGFTGSLTGSIGKFFTGGGTQGLNPQVDAMGSVVSVGAGGGQNVNIQQEITVTGAMSPEETGRAVGGAVTNANADAVRNMRGAAR